jgi:hypothetical protein
VSDPWAKVRELELRLADPALSDPERYRLQELNCLEHRNACQATGRSQ